MKRKCSWTMINLRIVGRYLDEGIKLMLVKQLVIEKQNLEKFNTFNTTI